MATVARRKVKIPFEKKDMEGTFVTLTESRKRRTPKPRRQYSWNKDSKSHSV